MPDGNVAVYPRTSPLEKFAEMLAFAPSIADEPVTVKALSTTPAGALFAIVIAVELPLILICENEMTERKRDKRVKNAFIVVNWI